MDDENYNEERESRKGKLKCERQALLILRQTDRNTKRYADEENHRDRQT